MYTPSSCLCTCGGKPLSLLLPADRAEVEGLEGCETPLLSRLTFLVSCGLFAELPPPFLPSFKGGIFGRSFSAISCLLQLLQMKVKPPLSACFGVKL